ncbi:hypothetical protein [Chitinophaga sp.]|uniref:hypothetical protein n=1 Tax=Chitinophaga sp. TaxID=1869181 RepID=UPI0031D48638
MHLLQHTHLSETEQQNPQLALSRFCNRNDLPHLRHQLWAWLRESLSADNSSYDSAPARDELLHTFEELNRLLDAVFLLHNMETTQLLNTA